MIHGRDTIRVNYISDCSKDESILKNFSKIV